MKIYIAIDEDSQILHTSVSLGLLFETIINNLKSTPLDKLIITKKDNFYSVIDTDPELKHYEKELSLIHI